MTKQRQLILDIIRGSPGHLTADEIYAEAKRRMPSVAVGTVYRNLGLMCDDYEIKRLPQPSGPDKYDKSCTPHEHLLCSHCGKLVDLDDMELKPYIESRAGVVVESYILQVNGICKSCLANQR